MAGKFQVHQPTQDILNSIKCLKWNQGRIQEFFEGGGV